LGSFCARRRGPGRDRKGAEWGRIPGRDERRKLGTLWHSRTHGCPCGYFGDATRACTCQQGTVDRYQKRLSGPLLDRIDLHVDVPRVEYEKLAADSVAESSAAVRARVEAARARQWARFDGSRVASNAEMGIRELKLHCGLDPAGEALLKAAVQRLGLSARAYHRVLKVARTIADLASVGRIGPAHLAEAIQYQRRSER
jgi:magnesium chelatase family protein